MSHSDSVYLYGLTAVNQVSIEATYFHRPQPATDSKGAYFIICFASCDKDQHATFLQLSHAFACRRPPKTWELPLRLFELGGVYESYGSFEGALFIYQHIAGSTPSVAGFEDVLFRSAVLMRYMSSLPVMTV